jgi:CBS domain containing-hemolysin-like protein
LPSGTSYLRPRQETLERVTLDNPATDVMTDLTHVTTITIDPAASIEDALQKMIHAGVRLLLVTNPQNVVLGVITAKDIHSEKPIKFLNKVGIRHQDILVRDIMTPAESLDVLRMEDVTRVSVGDIVATLKRVNRQHALVLETQTAGAPFAIRGIFSTSQIGRQLGMSIDDPVIAVTFAELGEALRT